MQNTGKILVNKKGEAKKKKRKKERGEAIVSAPSPAALLLLVNGEVQAETGIAP